MSTRTRRPLLELFVATPAKSALLTAGPLVLAIGQLANSYVNDFSPLLALGFAAAMIGFSVVAMGHHAAEHRLQRLEREFGPESNPRRGLQSKTDVDGDGRAEP